MSEWTAFAFFGKDNVDMTKQEHEDNDDLIDIIQGYLQYKFEPGYSEGDVPCCEMSLLRN